MAATPEGDAFRAEIRAWLEAHAPEALRGHPYTAENACWGGSKFVYDPPESRDWLQAAGERGITAPTWPTEYGGAGLDRAQAKILSEEMRRLQLPPPLIGFGLEMIGPTLLRYGSEEQKQQFLPPIVRGEIRWCQGYSEPDSGSDLASIQTRAVVDGDDYIVNGSKVWTSYGDVADWIFALVRTDPDAKKQEGITFLLIDLESEGCEVRPIQLISGKSPFCETRFDDVRVPRANVLGEVNAGWTVAKTLLGFEREMIADTFGKSSGEKKVAAKKVSRLVRAARDYGHEVDGRVEPVLRDEVARCEMDERAFSLTMQRSRDAARAGHAPGPESSFFKVYGTELNMRRHELMVRIAGVQGLGWEGPGYDADETQLTREWLRSRGNAIEGGTSEIQRNIIAKRVLGLPD
jgi:alkylation response protein AidB-like acyl-CoA dehydrogenase